MTDKDLSRLLCDAVDEPPVALDPRRVVGRARRRARRRAAWRTVTLAAAGTAVVALAASALAPSGVDGTLSPAMTAGPLTSPSANSSQQRGGNCRDDGEFLVTYIDFVQVGSESFHAQAAAPAGTRLGHTVMTVLCSYSVHSPEPGKEQLPGDAAILPAGTQLRAVDGFDPRFRLGAMHDGRIRLYELSRPSKGTTGADVFPGLADHVEAIVVLEDGETERGRIDDPERVAALVEQLMAAPYDPSHAERAAGSDAFVGLLLDDGSVVRRAYNTRASVLYPGLAMPQQFTDAIRAAWR